MISFLFWNLNKKDLRNEIASLALQYDIDILMFAECEIEPGNLLYVLNPPGRVYYEYSPGSCEKIKIFSKFPHEFIEPICEDKPRLTIRHINLPDKIESDILLAVTHLVDKDNFQPGDQLKEASEMENHIRVIEKQIGHSRTILVGDLNMNPFDDGVVGGFHSVMSRKIAMRRKGKRIIQNKEYPLFYNPMWGLFGDGTRGPPGTYYFDSPGHIAFFWHMFDQVLIRPALLDKFDSKDVLILDSDGIGQFLSKTGRPKQNKSDHLPILFKLEI